MHNSTDVSILIVNYNSFKLLQDCLASIFKHSIGFDFEIILIDNNSTEGNIEDILNDFKDGDKRLSAMISGCSEIKTYYYSNIEEAKIFLDSVLSN